MIRDQDRLGLYAVALLCVLAATMVASAMLTEPPSSARGRVVGVK